MWCARFSDKFNGDGDEHSIWLLLHVPEASRDMNYGALRTVCRLLRPFRAAARIHHRTYRRGSVIPNHRVILIHA